MASNFRRIEAGGDAQYSGRIAALLAEVKGQKEAFKADMAASRAESLSQLAGRDLSTMRFDEYFHRGAAAWASDFAERTGTVAQCRVRALEGLLAIRTVRLGVGVSMSIVHSQVCEGRTPDFGDGYDVWHAILASTADVFVTGDQRLYDHVRRVPGVPDFRAVKSLAAALSPEIPSR